MPSVPDRLSILLGCLYLAAISASCGRLSLTPNPSTPPPLIELGRAPVRDLEILLLEGPVVDARVVARGDLPDTCTILENVATDREGQLFTVILTTRRTAGAGCLARPVPFERVIPLNLVGLPAGDYQVQVNSKRVALRLERDNLVADTPVPDSRTASIAGVVWHDLCGYAGGRAADPEVVTDGCTPAEIGILVADGTRTAEEPGLAGIDVALGFGECPQRAVLQARTDETGAYQFSGLQAGVYCVFIDALSGTNRLGLLPGRWSAPGEDVGYRTVELRIGQDLLAADFGWDFDRFPAVNPPGCVFQAQFAEDVSYPDDSVLAPGQVFTKTWRVHNIGTCHWVPDHSLDFLAGDVMGGEAVSLPTVLAGESAELSVRLTAPLTEGAYRGDWILRDSEGQPFGSLEGFDLTLFVKIRVDEAARELGRIEGVVWADRCDLDLLGIPGPGCVPRALEDYVADGIRGPGESGIGGLKIRLYQGACSLRLALWSETRTDLAGQYAFTDLEFGRYCVVVDPLAEENQPRLLPGVWTSPGLEVGEQEVLIERAAPGGRADFGWDFHTEN